MITRKTGDHDLLCIDSIKVLDAKNLIKKD